MLIVDYNVFDDIYNRIHKEIKLKRIKDVAKVAGVSSATVSRVIHNKGYVAKRTRNRVLETIESLDYRMNGIAQSLRTKRTNTLGLVITQVYPDPFQANVALNVSIEAQKRGYRLILYNTQEINQDERDSVRFLIENRVDGIIFVYLINPDNAEMAVKSKIPVVLIERHRGIKNVNMILWDNKQGAYEATKHLINLGHHKIAFIGAALGDEVENEIYEGYKSGLRKYNIPFKKEWVRFGRMDYETGYTAVKDILKEGNIPSAFFIVNDISALGALLALHERGLDVPNDCSVVGWDNTLAPFACPPLTSVSHPVEEMARLAVKLLIEEKEEEEGLLPKKIILQPQLIIRSSTKTRIEEVK